MGERQKKNITDKRKNIESMPFQENHFAWQQGQVGDEIEMLPHTDLEKLG